MKKILVTGASGFIGRHLAERFKSNDLYTQDLTKTQIGKFYRFNLKEKNSINISIKAIKPEYIFHCAATIKRDEREREEIFEVNVQGTKNLIGALKKEKIKLFVYFSSGEVCAGGKSPLNKNSPYAPLSPYSESKIEGERLVKESGLPYVILRPILVYGPGQTGRMFIPQLIETAKKGEVFKMTPGEQKRDFIYVGDLIDLCEILIANPNKVNGKTFFVSAGNPISMGEVADIASELLGEKLKTDRTLPYRPNETMLYSADISDLTRITGWKPKTSMKEGLKKTIITGNIL